MRHRNRPRPATQTLRGLASYDARPPVALEAPAEMRERQLRELEQSAAELVEYFDWVAGVSLTNGMTSVIFGAGGVLLPPIPWGQRAIVEGISFQLWGAIGPLPVPSYMPMPVVANLFINGVPAPPPWNALNFQPQLLPVDAPHGLFELGPHERLTATVIPTDPNGYYPFAVLRVRGRILSNRVFARRKAP